MLLQLLTSEYDTVGDGIITAGRIGRYLTDKISQMNEGTPQTPVYNHLDGSGLGDFIFKIKSVLDNRGEESDIDSPVSQLYPLLKSIILNVEIAISIYYDLLVDNKISVKDFLEDSSKGNMLNILILLNKNVDALGYDEEERVRDKEILKELMSKITSNLKQLQPGAADSNDRQLLERELKNWCRKFIENICIPLIKKHDPDYQIKIQSQHSIPVLGPKSAGSQLELDLKEGFAHQFYDLTVSLSSLKSAVDSCTVESDNPVALKNIAKQYITISQLFKRDCNEFTKTVRKLIPLTDIDKIDMCLNAKIDELIVCFRNIAGRINDITLVMDGLSGEYELLWIRLWLS